MSNGYVHSVKVPRLYKCTADIVRRARENGANLKSLIFETKHTNTSAVYGLSMNTLRAFSQLDQLLENTKILVEQPRLDPWLARVLITELLWGKKKLQSEAKPIQTVLAYTDKLREEVKNLEYQKPIISHKDKAQKPRYVRINTLLLSIEEALSFLQEEGWELLPKSTTYPLYLQTVSRLSEPYFIQDFHIPEILTFPSGTVFYDHPGYQKGKLLLQDKASCLPVYLLLNPDVGSTVLDICAAPGMKATYIAAKLKNIGTVYAVEIDTARFKAMVQLVEKTKSSCVLSINQDALTLDPKQYSSVEYILVDPSCSGSGIVDRPEESNMIGRTDSERLKNLQSIQVYLLRYALFNFPKAKRIVYSTCSIHPEENEEVIDEVLADIGDAYRLVPGKQLLPNWMNFSSEQYQCGDRCLYARSDIDFCNGFFVAVFERNFDVPIPKFTRKGGNACSSVEADPDVKCDNKAKKVPHKKKRGKNKNTEEFLIGKVSDIESVSQTEDQAINEAKPKKRKKKLQETDACSSTNLNREELGSSKSESIQNETEDVESKKSKKKKKSKRKDIPEIRENNEVMEVNKDMENEPTKKKKKTGNKEDEKLCVTQKEQDETELLTKKKKKKQITDAIHIDNSEENEECERKNKKQKKKEKDVNQEEVKQESVGVQKKKKKKEG
ncbi:probable 28S rRNA (cytosine-C(5))-methyltransferase [Pseudomyrmex gracilis]|uniref:probable 28S rRNA (cytosine-C(5))-methyltransferase n=1 Tax=Pseudomyrmex gracilis TaxID=219809 RepID=UPI000994D6D5|nr:probable 28S rRNA (cytosine-C(5))-methyltransferase [Pseudomyrmex gracilis]